MLILFPMLSAFCRYLTLAFKGLVAPARAVTDTHTHRHTDWLLEMTVVCQQKTDQSDNDVIYYRNVGHCGASLSECMCRTWSSCMHMTVIRMRLSRKSVIQSVGDSSGDWIFLSDCLH